MTLENAFSRIIDKEGIGILTEPRLWNYLEDLHAFDFPGVKRVISTMIDADILEKLIPVLINDKGFESQFIDAEQRLVQDEGFQLGIVKYVLDSLMSAVHKNGNMPSTPQCSDETGLPIKGKKRIFPINNELKVDSANGFFLVTVGSQQYKLDKTQYRAIMRKRNMPLDRLEVWLKSYADENY